MNRPELTPAERRRAGIVAALLLAVLTACTVVSAVQLVDLLRTLVRVAVAQKTLIRELLAEVRGYSAGAVAAFDRAMADTAMAASVAAGGDTLEETAE